MDIIFLWEVRESEKKNWDQDMKSFLIKAVVIDKTEGHNKNARRKKNVFHPCIKTPTHYFTM